MTEKSAEIGKFMLKVDKKKVEDSFAEISGRFGVWKQVFKKN